MLFVPENEKNSKSKYSNMILTVTVFGNLESIVHDEMNKISV